MDRRKNTKRIDPRWFMDEKTDVIKEEIKKTLDEAEGDFKLSDYVQAGPPEFRGWVKDRARGAKSAVGLDHVPFGDRYKAAKKAFSTLDRGINLFTLLRGSRDWEDPNARSADGGRLVLQAIYPEATDEEIVAKLEKLKKNMLHQDISRVHSLIDLESLLGLGKSPHRLGRRRGGKHGPSYTTESEVPRQSIEQVIKEALEAALKV